MAGSVATSLFGLGPYAAVPLSAINMAEALLGAWLLQRVFPTFGNLQSSGEIGAFIAVAGIVSPGTMAFAGAGVAAAMADVPYWSNWLTWYTAHALGTIVVAPLVMLTLRGDILDWFREATPAQRGEAALLLAVLTVVTVAAFAQTQYPLLFLPFLPMMAAVFRLGRFGATTSVVLIGIIGGVCTARGLGPIPQDQGSSGLRAELFQLYLATAVLMVLPAAGDLKRRRHVMEQLEQQTVLHRLILDRTGDIIMTLELDGRIRFVSSASTRVLGLSPERLVGTMPHAIIHAADIARVEAVHREVLREPERTFTVEYRVAVAGREIGWFETHARATLDSDGQPNGAVVIVRDVSHRKSTETQLSDAAYSDPLTGIANRRAFDSALATRFGATTTSGPVVLAMFDLDHFKRINDTFGHAAGDRVLVAFADLLRSGVREGDLVARLGGEEFVAVIRGDLDAARHVCERVRARLAATEIALDTGLKVQATVSAGIAPMPPFGATADVLAAADAALYQAKANGRNRLWYKTELGV